MRQENVAEDTGIPDIKAHILGTVPVHAVKGGVDAVPVAHHHLLHGVCGDFGLRTHGSYATDIPIGHEAGHIVDLVRVGNEITVKPHTGDDIVLVLDQSDVLDLHPLAGGTADIQPQAGQRAGEVGSIGYIHDICVVFPVIGHCKIQALFCIEGGTTPCYEEQLR